MFKKLISLISFMMILLSSFGTCYADVVGFNGGVNNEYEYKEVVFLSGEPVTFVGEYSYKVKGKGTQKKVSYKFDLKDIKNKENELSRKIDYTVNYDIREDKGQTIANLVLDKYSESVEIDGVEYDLEDYQLSKSDVVDNRPVSDYMSGNTKARKYYLINKDQGKVIVEVSGGEVGYSNFWGNTQTKLMNYVISASRTEVDKDDDNDADDYNWNGTVEIQTSATMNKQIKYSNNDANYTSFEGGNVKVENSEVVSSYTYDLPDMGTDGTADNNDRKNGNIKISSNMVPKLQRLIVPKFKDIKGHWAQKYVEKLYSLDIFDERGEHFDPDIPMLRMEYTKAVMRACDIRVKANLGDSFTNFPVNNSNITKDEKMLFYDVDTNSQDFAFIEKGLEKGLIKGIDKRNFGADDKLTKAQAITIMIRGLGFENKAPNPGYKTNFSDDYTIPSWAKDAIYVAKEIGLIEGDSSNKIHANQILTRAEASKLLVRFMEFLEKDLKKDYRENIIYF